MKSSADAGVQPELLGVMKFATGLSLGAMAAFLCSIREVNPHLQFAFGTVSVLAFFLGAGLSWALWRAVLSPDDPGARFWFAFLSGVLVFGTFAGYAYALASLSSGRLREMVIGTIAAVATLSLLGMLFWKIARAFGD